jgi:hypothetical protein
MTATKVETTSAARTLTAGELLKTLHEPRSPVGRWLLLADMGGFTENLKVFGWRRGGWRELGPFFDGFGGTPDDWLTRGGAIACSPILREHHAGFPFSPVWTVWVSKRVDLEPRRSVEPLPRRTAASVAAVRAEFDRLPTPPQLLLEEGHRLTAIWRLREPASVEEIGLVLIGLAERLNGERRQARPGEARWLLPGVLSREVFPPHTVSAERLREGSVPLSDLGWALSPP